VSALSTLENNPFLAGILQAAQAVIPLVLTTGAVISPELKAAQTLFTLLPLAQATLTSWTRIGAMTSDQAAAVLDSVKADAWQAHSAWLASIKLHPPVPG
jgi:hypothetical protein